MSFMNYVSPLDIKMVCGNSNGFSILYVPYSDFFYDKSIHAFAVLQLLNKKAYHSCRNMQVSLIGTVLA